MSVCVYTHVCMNVSIYLCALDHPHLLDVSVLDLHLCLRVPGDVFFVFFETFFLGFFRLSFFLRHICGCGGRSTSLFLRVCKSPGDSPFCFRILVINLFTSHVSTNLQLSVLLRVTVVWRVWVCQTHLACLHSHTWEYTFTFIHVLSVCTHTHGNTHSYTYTYTLHTPRTTNNLHVKFLVFFRCHRPWVSPAQCMSDRRQLWYNYTGGPSLHQILTCMHTCLAKWVQYLLLQAVSTTASPQQ